MTDVPGEWLTVPPGTEYVEPEVDLKNRRASLAYNDNNMSEAFGSANRGVLASGGSLRNLFGDAGEGTYPDGFLPSVFGQGSYGLAECIRSRILEFSPEVLPGVVRPPDAFAYEWEDNGTSIAYELREFASQPEGIPLFASTGQRTGAVQPRAELTGYLYLGLIPGSTITTAPDPSPSDPERETATGPRPASLGLPQVASVFVPADFVGTVTTPLSRRQVPYSGGEWLALATSSSWVIEQSEAGKPFIFGLSGTGDVDVHAVLGDPWPRYRWIYTGGPVEPSTRYGWGVLLG